MAVAYPGPIGDSLAFLDFLNDGDPPEKPVHRSVALIPLAMLLFAVAYNFYSLYPEVRIQVLDLNDRVLHLAVLDRASSVLDLGTGFTDPWLYSIGMGYPLFHHYQHLPYLAPALALGYGVLRHGRGDFWATLLLGATLMSHLLLDFFDETRPEHYNLFNVRYVVAPADRDFPEFVQPLQEFGRHRLYKVATTGYFGLVGSELSFRGEKKGFYPAASTWLASGLPGVKQHPSIKFQGESGDAEPAFLLSNAEYLIG